MSGDFLHNRRCALEDAFFAKHDKVLRRRLQEAGGTASKRQAITTATGTTDPAVPDKLAGLGGGGNTLAALSLVPLVVAAWVGGSIDGRERAAILSGAGAAGLDQDGASCALLERRLAQGPSSELMEAWKAYVGAVSSTLNDAGRKTLKGELLERAPVVAEAAGGILGLARKVSPAEDAALKQLEGALQ
jgi:hypothetical protein